ncbi:hypothetical protein MHU86_13236 [Fragilaria crotonensis]|nr:hypothetical protein MHU86_13236 [Fragilaria crotonensis]
MTSTCSPSLQCPICADDMSLSVGIASGKRRSLGLPCCGQLICQECLYRHIQTIFDEGRSGLGRSKLSCPLGCGEELTDKVVRASIEGAHGTITQWFWRSVGEMLRYLTTVDASCGLQQAAPFWHYWSNSAPVLADFEKYEQWSLVVALRAEPTMYCPAPGCDYQWITNDVYRQEKQAHEAKGAFLWYTPPKSDRGGNFNWVEPEFANLGATGNFVEPDLSDGRRMVCAKCLTCFCGLCRRPWEFGTGRRQRCHRGKTCEKYRKSVPFDDGDYVYVAQLANARSCPGCSMRTQRTEGCNHMTCPCGYEWCYVCECRWNRMHYPCVDQGLGGDATGACVVS